MRILVTGKSGQVAMSLAAQARHLNGVELLALGRPTLDLEDPAAARAVIIAAAPDLVVNAAAYTAVDKAEADAARAFAINRDGAQAVAQAAATLHVPLIHLSTDYVFDGAKAAPYVETDSTAPLNVYGHSKREGETAVLAAYPPAFIFRTAWVFSPFGANFVKTMLRLGAERPSLRIVSDQFGNPTSAADIAAAIFEIAPQLVATPGSGGIYHLTNAGSTSWFGLAQAIFAEGARHGGPAPVLEPITTADYPTPARRPANSRLDTAAFGRRFGYAFRPWQEAVAETVRHLLLEPC
jgi:dTDP-4-dehydrorhamnose reductase